jgi:hypothetical protein
MTDPQDTPDLREFVHERYRRADAKLDRMLDAIADLAGRQNETTQALLTLARGHVTDAETLARQQVQIDRLWKEIDRINRRLEITD